MENKEASFKIRTVGVGTGAVSLLMIFTVLGLTTLALLGLSTSLANRRMGEKSLQNNHQIAQAEQDAAQELADIDAYLAALQTQYPEDEPTYYANAQTWLSGRGYALNWKEKEATFIVAVSDSAQLEYTFTTLPPSSPYRYHITKEILVSTTEWQPEQGGQLWQG